MLKIAGIEEPKNVFIFLPRVVDYLSLCIEQGFAELGINYTTNEHDYSETVSEEIVMSMIPTNDQLSNAQFVTSMQPSSSTSESKEEINFNNNNNKVQMSNALWPPWQKRFNSSITQGMTFENWTKVHTGSEPPFLGHHQYGMSSMYGRGFVWGMRGDPPPNERVSLFNNRNNNKQKVQQGSSSSSSFFKASLQERFERKEFDLIVYSALFLFSTGRFHSSVSKLLPYLRTIRDAYQGEWNRVLFCDGDDIPLEAQHWGPLLEEMVVATVNGGNGKASAKMFVRESYFLDRKMVKNEMLPQWF